jgi:hypothetical protein
MDTHTRDKIARAYSRLVALRRNTSETTFSVDEEHVRQYHEALQHLTDLGFDIAEFQIPDQWLKYPAVSSRPGPGGREVRYGKQRKVETSKFLSKLDAVMEYFSLTTSADSGSNERRTIGFTAPEE